MSKKQYYEIEEENGRPNSSDFVYVTYSSKDCKGQIQLRNYGNDRNLEFTLAELPGIIELLTKVKEAIDEQV